MDEAISQGVWNPDYKSDESSSVLFEQYKIYVEMADRISARRDIANGFFLGLHSLVGTGVLLAFDKNTLFSGKLIFVPIICVCAQFVIIGFVS